MVFKACHCSCWRRSQLLTEEARQRDSGVCWADVRTVKPSRPISRPVRMIVWPVVPRLLVQLSNELPYLDHKSGGRGGRARSGRDQISHYFFFLRKLIHTSGDQISHYYKRFIVVSIER